MQEVYTVVLVVVVVTRRRPRRSMKVSLVPSAVVEVRFYLLTESRECLRLVQFLKSV